MKEEALKLADELDALHQYVPSEAPAMIRRLVEELDKKSKPVNHYEPTAWINHIKQTGGDFYELNVSGRGEPLYRHTPQTKPLSDEELLNIWWDVEDDEALIKFARAIEERHGIK